jgi:phage head maturation protease
MAPNRPPDPAGDRVDLFVDGLRFEATGVDGDAPIRVAGLALPWSTPVPLNAWGDTVDFAPSSVDPAHPARVKFLLDHNDHAMGYGVSFTAEADGLHAVMEVPRSELVDPATATAVRQMGNGIRDALSVGVIVDKADRHPGDDGDHFTVTAATLVELSSVLVPRFDAARHDRVAASARHLNSQGVTMPTDAPPFPARTTPPAMLAALDGPPDDTPPDDDDPDAELTAAAPRHPANRGNVVAYSGRRGPAVDTSLRGVAMALAATGGDPRLVKAALTNVTTADVPGLIRPQYVDELVGLVNLGTPAISAFRQGIVTSNPIVYPHWTTLPVVDVVTGEKVAIPSGAVNIASASIAVKTYAGGNDVSVQTLDWSSPDFLTAYFQACAEVYARKIESAFETALDTWATGVPTTGNLVGDIGAAIGAVAGTGLPGSFIMLMSGDVFGKLFTELAGTSGSIFGIVNASFPQPKIVVGPFLPPATLITGMTGTAITFQNSGAPVRLRAVDVSLLGVDLGVYGYFASALLYPASLRKVTGITALAGATAFTDEQQAPVDLLAPGNRKPAGDTAKK